MEEIQSRHNRELDHPKWLHKRHQVLTRDMFKCQGCHIKQLLEVHHLYYVRGASLWEYPKNALITLCRSCHQEWHNTHDIEYRDKVWGKNREYESPLKSKKNRGKKKQSTWYVPKLKRRVVNHPAVVSEKQRELLKRRNTRKRILLREAGYRDKELVSMYKQTKTLTIDELKAYLLASNI